MSNVKVLNKSKINTFVSEKHWRIYVLVFFILAGAAIITARIYSLQVTDSPTYRAIAENQHKILEELDPRRGEIYLQEDNELYPLAVNREYQMVYAIPKEIKEKEKAVLNLAPVLGIDEQELRRKFSDPDDVFEILKHKLSGEEIDKIREINLRRNKFRSGKLPLLSSRGNGRSSGGFCRFGRGKIQRALRDRIFLGRGTRGERGNARAGKRRGRKMDFGG